MGKKKKTFKMLMTQISMSLTPEQRAEFSNGCGPARAFIDVVPDNILGLDITDICNEHDINYEFGETSENKRRADYAFFVNLQRKIEAAGGLLKCFRLRIAKKYYVAVKHMGDGAFWTEDKLLHDFCEVEKEF